jgi:hypothetical protein
VFLFCLANRLPYNQILLNQAKKLLANLHRFKNN